MSDSALARDKADSLADLKELFQLPAGVVYLDGNSLGALPRAVTAAVKDVVEHQWGDDLITSWNAHDWIRLPNLVGEKLAPLIGAAPGQVLCSDSISVNLFKLLATAIELNTGRRIILAVDEDFPTDAYIAQGLSQMLGEDRCELRRVAAQDVQAALSDDVAVLMLTEVNYRSGERHDMQALTDAAHAAGALVLWDLAHSAGVLPIELDRRGVDLAVGCGYKYFNGGPGAPAFLYVNKRHHARARQPLSGWLGHQDPFAFASDYEAAGGVQHYQAGTPGIISMAALNAALDVFQRVSIEQLREKSLALTDFFIEGIETRGLLASLECITPREHHRRGSQVSLRYEHAWGLSQALIEAQVIVDFRATDIVRFGFSPLYNSFSDAQKALDVLEEILVKGLHLDDRFATRPTVT
ncbi:kynureninase [Congregibacter brevis]|uniref:Kynureninase n=1 Tax=Congregibacter brevis TaxID=3081201 RepID=A0ABZ0IAT6_9GAMM|nr:kynureninase [Congregibacter sp. IMCC45268]